ncbi:hypothetical protein QFC22_003814 [Naganishia vaughanmartiniae]|uniref:Uncharacterized protein n=1 Tax=Naganishia vaughanmartiniae TaxID=1424756 RepID=A0ACC2X5D0_9TREE|nr:hypothetical protein QFC22_003814 [Naganishia vaughanmartiniae]
MPRKYNSLVGSRPGRGLRRKPSYPDLSYKDIASPATKRVPSSLYGLPRLSGSTLHLNPTTYPPSVPSDSEKSPTRSSPSSIGTNASEDTSSFSDEEDNVSVESDLNETSTGDVLYDHYLRRCDFEGVPAVGPSSDCLRGRFMGMNSSGFPDVDDLQTAAQRLMYYNIDSIEECAEDATGNNGSLNEERLSVNPESRLRPISDALTFKTFTTGSPSPSDNNSCLPPSEWWESPEAAFFTRPTAWQSHRTAHDSSDESTLPGLARKARMQKAKLVDITNTKSTASWRKMRLAFPDIVRPGNQMIDSTNNSSADPSSGSHLSSRPTSIFEPFDGEPFLQFGSIQEIFRQDGRSSSGLRGRETSLLDKTGSDKDMLLQSPYDKALPPIPRRRRSKGHRVKRRVGGYLQNWLSSASRVTSRCSRTMKEEMTISDTTGGEGRRTTLGSGLLGARLDPRARKREGEATLDPATRLSRQASQRGKAEKKREPWYRAFRRRGTNKRITKVPLAAANSKSLLRGPTKLHRKGKGGKVTDRIDDGRRQFYSSS